MIEALQKLVAAERKHARELKELRDLRQKIASHKTPDTKTIALIDNEIAVYLGQK